MDALTLAHITWNCKYRIVFAPKCRQQIIYGKYKVKIGKILRTLCERKEIEIIEAYLYALIIFMCFSAYLMGYLKGKSSLMIFDRFSNLKYRYGNRQF